MKRVPVIGLFAGAGGLDLGAALAGGDVRLSVDNDALCCQTLRDNSTVHIGRIEQKDLSTVTGVQLRSWAGLNPTEPCVVIGGPPCQPFSKAAYWTDPGDDSRYRKARARGEKAGPKPLPILEARPDDRRDLLYHYWRLVLETKAIGFVFENVPSIKHPRNRPVFERLIADAEMAGYHILPLDVNAADFGVAQRRHRVVLLGLQGATPPPPTPLEQIVTSGMALAPFAGSEYFEREEVVKGTWESQLREVPPGMNYKALTAWAGHPNPSFVAETRYWHFLLKLSPDLPSWTIPANPGPWVGPFHWDSRRLRTVELAALQGFPPGYRFAGNRRDKVRQIGNAVPPPLARHVIEPMLSLLATGAYRPPAQALVS